MTDIQSSKPLHLRELDLTREHISLSESVKLEMPPSMSVPTPSRIFGTGRWGSNIDGRIGPSMFGYVCVHLRFLKFYCMNEYVGNSRMNWDI
jgi:hypothetical protein